MQPVFARGFHASIGIGEAVHIADLVAIVGGDGSLHNTQPPRQELDHDLRIKMPFIGTALKGNLGERMTIVGSITGMKLPKTRLKRSILYGGENFVPDELVERQIGRASCRER